MTDELHPVSRDELIHKLAIALAVNGRWLPARGRNGTPPDKMDEIRNRLAERLADSLLQSSIRIFRLPPSPRHSTGPMHGPGSD